MDLLPKLLLELFCDGLEAELLVPPSVGPSQVGGEHDRLRVLREGVPDRREGGDDAGGIGDGPGLLVLGAVEVDPVDVKSWLKLESI